MYSNLGFLFFGAFVTFVIALPQQGLPVVRPNHYFQQGTLKNLHILPLSFFSPRENVESDLRNAASQHLPQQSQVAAVQTAPAPASTDEKSGNKEGESNIPDSYSNIGGASGSVASSLTNTNEYGEIVPEAFSNIKHEHTYAYYHGQ